MLVELIEGGYIGQAIVATGVVIGVLIEVSRGQPVDPILAAFLGTVVGYFFRMGVVQAQHMNDAP